MVDDDNKSCWTSKDSLGGRITQMSTRRNVSDTMNMFEMTRSCAVEAADLKSRQFKVKVKKLISKNLDSGSESYYLYIFYLFNNSSYM